MGFSVSRRTHGLTLKLQQLYCWLVTTEAIDMRVSSLSGCDRARIFHVSARVRKLGCHIRDQSSHLPVCSQTSMKGELLAVH